MGKIKISAEFIFFQIFKQHEMQFKVQNKDGFFSCHQHVIKTNEQLCVFKVDHSSADLYYIKKETLTNNNKDKSHLSLTS